MTTPVEGLLGQGRIVLHPFVFGELLLNGLPKSGPFSASAFATYAVAPLATTPEVAAFIQWAKLSGKGVGYVDTHLLISARYLPDGKLLTSDNDLRAQAERLGVAYEHD
ncbi:MAG: VapC toxin family PIN domain ribonuclease [Sphingomonadales bacterium]